MGVCENYNIIIYDDFEKYSDGDNLDMGDWTKNYDNDI